MILCLIGRKVVIAVCKDSYVVYACGLTETENENDSANQNNIAKMMLQNDVAALTTRW